MGLLSLAIWTPVFFGVVLLALGKYEQATAVRWIALIGALVSLAVMPMLLKKAEDAAKAAPAAQVFRGEVA